MVQRKISGTVRRTWFIDLGSSMEEDFLTKSVTNAFSSSSVVHGDNLGENGSIFVAVYCGFHDRGYIIKSEIFIQILHHIPVV